MVPGKSTCAAALALICALSAWASAAAIADFKPAPTSPGIPEFVFTRAFGGAPVFRAGPGSASNNDGNLPLQNQTAPGLDVETPFILAGPGALNDLIAGTTHFLDASIQFTAGLQANSPALFAGGLFIQSLSPGSFQIMSTGPAPVALLTGNLSAASFISGAGGAGAVLNASSVNYTGGIIYNALLANGGNPNGNDFSISMVDVTPIFGINANDGFLNDFTANATGLFSVNTIVPEPATLTTALALAAGMVLARRR